MNLELKKIVTEKFMEMVETISNTKKTCRTFNTDTNIYRSEIHIIKLIGDYHSLHVSELARKSGVTKGAVSQLLKKLEAKDLVQKYLDETNNSRTLVRLTDKGKVAYHGHEEYHHLYDQDMIQFMTSLTQAEIDLIMVFMDKVIDMTNHHV